METTVFAFTPPFTQLNTPYPATAYLKGFLNTKNISCFQADLGIEVILSIYSKKGFEDLFNHIKNSDNDHSENSKRMIAFAPHYIDTIDSVIAFLQDKNPTYAHLICQSHYLPTASRFDQLHTYQNKTFGTAASHDMAKHLATLYLEDISDLIKECIDPHFGFSRYAERLGRSANSFDEIYKHLNQAYTYIDKILLDHLEAKIKFISPKLVAISVPFPGNLYTAFRCAQWIKKTYPEIKIAMGGGFANTELRSLSDPRVFEFFDFITLDDGELPLEYIIKYTLANTSSINLSYFKRTFALINNQVEYINNAPRNDYPQAETGTPDYSDLKLQDYISVLEIVNPMHRLWSDGRWNKLTLAHGCYWGKCTFCDISLDYIKVYEPLAASLICDRMEKIIEQTGQNGFHFVDEAAPPARMRALALEIIKRKLSVSWWTNIRFEKSFSPDLCYLLKASGCIAVSGGLEVASDRLLDLIQKGVSVAQVAQVCKHFQDAGIMVHAYLMYGFPSQTVQETVDSLEMVRQLFEAGVLKSGYWHQFAMTVHSPVGMDPEQFKVKKQNEKIGSFANNDLEFIDPSGIDHDTFSFGLKKSILNYMHGLCLDYRLQEWFEFKIPKPKVSKDYIQKVLEYKEKAVFNFQSRLVWLGQYQLNTKPSQKNEAFIRLTFYFKKSEFHLELETNQALWLLEILDLISPSVTPLLSLENIKEMHASVGFIDFDRFCSQVFIPLRKQGLLVF